MTTSKPNSWIFCVAASVTIAVAFSGRLAGQTAAVGSSAGSSGSGTEWSVQVERIDPGQLDLAHSFQVAIYENLLDELNKTKRFKQVFREGDSKASEPSELADLEDHGREVYPRERNAACGDHRERRDKVNGAKSTPHTGRQDCARSHGGRERSLLRQQFARYPQFGPQYRQSDQAIGMARIRAAGAKLTSQL